MVSLAERRRAVTYIRNEYAISERRACQAMQLNRSSYRYVTSKELNDETYWEVVRLSQHYPYWSYRKIFELMKEQQIAISRERVRLIRRREGMQVVRKRKKRRILGQMTQWVHWACYPNHVWSYDFVFDQTEDRRTLKCLTVVDEFTRQGLDIRVARSSTASDVIRILDELFQMYGWPVCLRNDNGPELVSHAVQDWLKDKHAGTHYIEPGSPWQNAYNESFSSIFRTTCLDRWLFSSMTEARVVIQQWLEENNTISRHGSMADMNPEYFLQRWIEGKMNQQPKTLTA